MTIRRKKWTVAEDKRLREMCMTHTSAAIAEILGRTEDSIAGHIFVLGLMKKPELKRSIKVAEKADEMGAALSLLAQLPMMGLMRHA